MRSTLPSILLVLSIGSVGTAAGSAAPTGSDVAVLQTGSPWRCHLTWKTEVVRTAEGDLKPVRFQTGSSTDIVRTPFPPVNWADPDFDDSAWARFHGPLPHGSRSLALICLRGTFTVTDPAEVGDLTLSMAYRGGVIVSLNGHEVVRAHMPDGDVTFDALAEDYRKEAYVNPEGLLLRYGFREPKKYADRFALRERRLESVTVPARLLRTGTNVLALQLHRAPTSHLFVTGRAKGGMERFYCSWSMVMFKRLTLTARNGVRPPDVKGSDPFLVPTTGAPKGLRAWSDSPLRWVRRTEYATPNETPTPVRIVGCRGGAFAGQVVVGSDTAIRGLSVQAGPLGTAGGDGRIPAGAVQVRFARPNASTGRRPPPLDALETAAPAAVPAASGCAVQPVWITARVPRDAAPGTYTGRLGISADGEHPIEVPVVLRVIDWALPNPRAFRAHVGLIQSPDSVALMYDVPLWSEAHWKLLERTFALLGQVGTDVVYLPLICDTYHGNRETMVRWIKGAPSPDGTASETFTHDFSIAERYLDLAVKHLGKPPVVCLYVWHGQGGLWAPTNRDLGTQKRPARVTRLDPSTGTVDRLDVPFWGTPGSVPFWKPVFDGMRDRLAKRGLAGAMMVGVALDNRPLQVTVDDLRRLAPEAKWVLHSHMAAGGSITRAIIGYGAHVWCSYRLYDPTAKPNRDWQRNPYLFTGFPRSGVGGVVSLRYSCRTDPAVTYRALPEGLMAAGHNGFGRVGADFWACRKDSRGRRYPIFGKASVSLGDSNPAVLAPGVSGPIATIRFENLREGLQETEARLFIETALADPALRGRLGDELVKTCRALLDDRVRTLLLYEGRSTTRQGNPSNWALLRAYPWQHDSERLYTTAADVHRALAGNGVEQNR